MWYELTTANPHTGKALTCVTLSSWLECDISRNCFADITPHLKNDSFQQYLVTVIELGD